MGIKDAIDVPEAVRALAAAVAAAGGRAWLVGGTVRDALLGRPAKDLDVEVHGLDAGALEPILAQVGSARAVGRSFGVFKLRAGGLELDVALPRGDSRGGDRGAVSGDPSLSLDEAARRRDFTINAMAWDPLDDRLADPLGGQADLVAKRLRAADPSRFGDDPLRVWRVARFAAVLGFTPAPELVSLCRGIDTTAVPASRVMGELEKLLLQAPRPSVGLAVADAVGARGTWLPAVRADAGDVLDRAATLRDGAFDEALALGLLLAALLAGVREEEAAATLDRLGLVTRGGWALRAEVLAALAAVPTLSVPADDATLRTLAERLEVGFACRVAAALAGGRAAGDNEWRAEELGVARGPLPPLVRGRDLQRIGVPAGPALGRVLAAVRAAQLAGDVTTPDGAMALAGRLWSDRPDGGAGA